MIRWRRRNNPTLHVTGLALLFLSPGMAACATIEWASPTSHDEAALVAGALVAAGIGLGLRLTTTVGDDLATVSVFSVVAWTWLASAVAGALPYVFGSMFRWTEFDLALFESISGFTCTGSSVLADIEAHGRGILMWRQLTNWYGGMGVVVLAVTVLPYLGVGGLAMMTVEAPGHSSDRLAPRVSDTARILWILYVRVTMAIAAALWVVPGVDLYDAVAHSFATAATGGLSPYNASVGHFDSVLVELVLIVGMVFCALNFALHYRFFTGDRHAYARSTETTTYLAILLAGAVLTSVVLVDETTSSSGAAVRNAAFNVVSLGTSTGFGNATEGAGSAADFVLWPAAAQIVLLAMMAIGGCVGSTAGGLKTYRVLIGAKHVLRELRRLEHPRGIFPVKLGREVVPEQIVASALGFVGLFFVFTLAGTLVLTGMGVDLLTASSGALGSMSNMGPALGEAGPTASFLSYPRAGRAVLAFLMLVGRLEIVTVLLMFAAAVRSARYRRVRRDLVSGSPAARRTRGEPRDGHAAGVRVATMTSSNSPS